ncbi:Protein of unknown function [Blastococcus aggregatus]|uniref:DUF402 domain-containing protein n=1 Tax=Blastococcus aggregatus TaxID=38502 RepID=A0A285V795_9ACTN|nr:DUF402 domain-containing protein [Blastococcus aggregatus]SOC49930.1 Protein of unknown function [Blastococcus aggregatus]
MPDPTVVLPERFAVGSTVRRREVLHGRPWMEHPVTVIHDGDDCLAVLLESGSPFAFFEHPFGRHPWSRFEAWSGSTVLQVQREGDAHSAWKFFDERGDFTHWYVNLQEPFARHVDRCGGGAFDTADHGIDIVLPADGSPWRWKDVDDPDVMVAAGRITGVERDRIRAEADSIAARLDAGDRWWSPWEGWRPGDPSPEPASAERGGALRRG